MNTSAEIGTAHCSIPAGHVEDAWTHLTSSPEWPEDLAHTLADPAGAPAPQGLPEFLTRLGFDIEHEPLGAVIVRGYRPGAWGRERDILARLAEFVADNSYLDLIIRTPDGLVEERRLLFRDGVMECLPLPEPPPF